MFSIVYNLIIYNKRYRMIYLTGDTHGDLDIHCLRSRSFPEGKELTKEDYVIVLGDFGFLWSNPPTATEKYWLNWLEEKPWVTLFLAGNHENYDMINALEEIPMFGSKVGKVNDSIYHLKTGFVYNINNKKILIIGGGESIDKYRRTEGVTWWKEELISYKQQELLFENVENNQEVDFVLSHTCPYSIFKKMGLNELTRNDPTMKILQEVKDRINFKKWYFGHFHMDRFINEQFMCLYNSVIELF